MRISRKVRISEALLLGGLFLFGGCASPTKPRLSVNAQAEALSHFSLGLLAGAGGNSPAALEHLEAAIRLDPTEEKLYAPAVAMALELKQTNNAVRLARQLVKHCSGAANSQLLLAQVYVLTGQPEQAESLLRKVLIKFPDNPEAPLLLARFYISQERRIDAFKILRTAVTIQPRNAELFHLLGTLCVDSARKSGDTSAIQEGITFLQQAIALDPQDPLRWQQLGLAWLAVKQPEEALTALQEARRYAPADLTLAGQMFELLIQIGKYDDAMALYDQLAAETGTTPELWLQYLSEKMPKEEHTHLISHLESQIRKQPRAAVFYYAQLGALYIGEHKNREAETVLLKALEQYPDDNRLRTVLGYLHLQQERYDEAYSALESVRTESPEAEWSSNPFFLFNFLVSAQKSGHLEEAAQILASTYTNNPVIINQYMNSLLTDRTPVSTESAIELLNVFYTLSPEAAEALYYLMVLQAEQKEYKQALETAGKFEKLVQKIGQTNLLSGSFYYQLASLYERTGQLESAEKLFFKAIELGECAVAAASRNYIAYMWAERGEKLELGLSLVQQALTVDSENGAFLDTLGWIYYMQGRYTEALKELQKAQSVIQDDPTVWEHLGDTYSKLGNRDEAFKHWKRALELNPGSERLIELLKANGFTPDKYQAPEDIPEDTTPQP